MRLSAPSPTSLKTFVEEINILLYRTIIIVEQIFLYQSLQIFRDIVRECTKDLFYIIIIEYTYNQKEMVASLL